MKSLATTVGIGKNIIMRPLDRLPLLLCALLVLAACVSGPDRNKLDDALYHYAGAIRWGEIDAALGFIDPDWLRAHPLSSLDRERFNQVSVSGYSVLSRETNPAGQIIQIVELRLINRHTQTERVLIDRQIWRWDAQAKHWWNTSGLPDLGRVRD